MFQIIKTNPFIGFNQQNSITDGALPWNSKWLPYLTMGASWIIQCVPQKGKPINLVNFSENCNDLSEKAYIFTKFSLSSFFWHQIQDVLTMQNKHWPFQMVMSKMICTEWEFKGSGSATFQSKGRVERHSLVFLLSLLSCFFCLLLSDMD